MISNTRYHLQSEINRQQKLAADIARAQSDLSNETRLQRASDDPAASARVADIRRAQANEAVWARNVDSASALATRADSTLKSVAERGEIVLGYRESSVPFSFVEGKQPDGSPRPIGYAIDLCGEIADDVQAAIGRPVKIRYAPVTAETRIEAVTSGKIDLECGSTTANAERRKQVAFSPVDYISATQLLVRRGAGIASYRDLGGRTVVVTAGTWTPDVVKLPGL